MLRHKMMKPCSVFFLCFFCFSWMNIIHAQTIDKSLIPPTQSPEYAKLKAQGKLPKGPVMIMNGDTMSIPMTARIQPSSPQSVLCSCMIPIDASFQVAPFQFYTGPDYRHDDGSTAAITIPF